MNVLLVFPRCKYPSPDIPLGVGYLASFLRQHEPGVDVRIFDATWKKDPMKAFREELQQRKYDLIGFSIMTVMRKYCREMIGIARQEAPHSTIVLGGPHPTVAADDSLGLGENLIVAQGEGEDTLLDLVRAEGDPTDIPGLVYLKDGEKVVNSPRDVRQNLDELPFPAWDLMETEHYFDQWFVFDAIRRFRRGTHIITTRGCPWRCTYCQPTLNTLFGRKMRKRSPENIVAEVRALKEQFGVEAFFITDDAFLIDRKWVYRVLDALNESGLNMPWGCNARVDQIREEMVGDLAASGMVRVNMGIESASQRVLDSLYDKCITLEQIDTATSLLRQHGVSQTGYFILGAPTETEEEMKATIRYAAKLPLDEASFNICTPLPHTHLHDKTKQDVELDYDHYDYYSGSVYNEQAVPLKAKLKSLRRRAYFTFYLTPPRLQRTLLQAIHPVNLGRNAMKLKRVFA